MDKGISTNDKTSISHRVLQDTFAAQDVEQPLVTRFEQQAARSPHNIAIQTPDRDVTYKGLNSFANQIGQAIIDEIGLGIEPVVILFNQHLPVIASMFAVLKAGKMYVPLDANNPYVRLTHILENSQARLIITDNNHMGLAEEIAENQRIINISEIDSSMSCDNLGIKSNPDDDIAIYYTSGSTGEVKGVVINNRAEMHRQWRFAEDMKITQADRSALIYSFSFGASKPDIFGTLLNGAMACPFDLKKEGLKRLIAWLDRTGISTLHIPVTLFREMIEALPKKENFQRLRFIALGGETIHMRDVHSFQEYFSADCRLISRFSTTETHTVSEVFIDQNMKMTGNIVPSGYPLEGKEVLILDQEGHELENGQVGEIAVRSRYLTTGYWRDPDLTSKKYINDPRSKDVRIFLTGDLGRLRPDGMLEHLGRKDFQVKIRGYRVNPSEVEAALFDLDGVKEAIVLVHEDGKNQKRIVAYVVPKTVANITPESLRKDLSTLIPDYMLPSNFILMDTFPTTTTGKVDRNALPAPDIATRPKIGKEYVAPRDDLEKRLVRAWEQVLEVKPIGLQDNFFDLGGDSLKAMRLFVQIEQDLGERLPLAMLLQAPTIETQARLLRQEGWTPDWSSLVALRSEGTNPPIFFMAPGGGNVLTYRDLTAILDSTQPCYALQSLGMDGGQKPLTRVEDIATHYIQEVKKVQPKGPYYLCGSSFGGKVAYEMAQQLHEAGDRIALVAMFDTRGINYPRKMPGMTYRRKKFYKIIRNIEKHASNLGMLNWDRKLVYLRKLGKKSLKRFHRWSRERYMERRFPMPTALKEIDAVHRKIKYRPLPPKFDGRLVLFRASQQPIGIYPDPSLGWSSLAPARLEIYQVPGNHTTLIYEPRVGVLAQKLKEILDELYLKQPTDKV